MEAAAPTLVKASSICCASDCGVLPVAVVPPLFCFYIDFSSLPGSVLATTFSLLTRDGQGRGIPSLGV